MEELLDELLAKRQLSQALMRQNRKYSERCCTVALLRDRMRKWCEDLLDDLTLIDAEDIDHSTYRSHLRYLLTGVGDCWKNIEVPLTRVYKDVGWLHEKLLVLEPNTAGLWWYMAEDINKRQQLIEDSISRFYELHEIFKETVDIYLEFIRAQNLFIFEKYKHY